MFKQAIFFTILFVLFVAILAARWFWNDYQYEISHPIVLTEEKTFTIEPGSNLKTVSKQLAAAGYIHHPTYLVVLARLRQIDNRIKAGEYELKPGMTPGDMLDLFISGKVKQYSLTLIEGWTFKQLIEFINKTPLLVHTLDEQATEKIMLKITGQDLSPEGEFFPDTYNFPRKTTDMDFLKRAHERLEHILAEEWQNRDADLPYQLPYQALIMASLIEKETGLASERPLIAGVFVRRLEKGMKLQTDPTVIYALGDNYDGNIRLTDLSIDSPYNTYRYPGLPPTPIALAGREALHAALHPAAGNSLYFVAKGDGSHHFSSTLEEHNKAVKKYQLNQ